MKRRLDETRGIGILSAIILMGMVTALIAASIPAVNQVTVAARTLQTRKDLQAIKVALTGNPDLVIENGRADFGFIGSMGNIPSALTDLSIRSSQPSYTFDTVKLVGAGWVGPYPPTPFVEDLLALDQDPFGNDYVYTSTAFNRSSDNALVGARILSRGPDGTEGTSDDMLVDILNGEIFSTVTGTLMRNNQIVPFASVTLNTPVSGAVSQSFAVTDANGDFSFTDVSFGFRSLAIDPRLTYEDGTAKLQGTRLKFSVTNFGSDSLDVTSMTATYTTSPASFYEEVKIGNTEVFDYVTDNASVRVGTGATINFSAVTIAGTGKATQVIPIRVEKENQIAPDLEIRGVGKSVVVEIRDFKDAATGSAGAVSVSGITFTINFSDGSANTFTVP